MTPLDLNATSPDLTPQRLPDNIERSAQDTLEAETQFLIRQTRLWRVLNSAQWVAWGIVQAKVPGMEDDGGSTPTPPVDSDVDESDEFDYLAYAQDRAFFFWADLVALGFVQKEQLPESLAEAVEGRQLEY
jgi:choline kinase